MRLRRLCEVKRSGKSWVSQELRDDYHAGGEKRESLELALLETIRGVGAEAKHEVIRVTRPI